MNVPAAQPNMALLVWQLAAGTPLARSVATQNRLLEMARLMQRLSESPAARWGVAGGGDPG